jgi:hypothetical protein
MSESIICILAVGAFACMLYSMLYFNGDSALTKFPKSLNADQLTLYNKVIKERMTRFLQGLILGLVLGFVYLNYSRSAGEVIKSQCVFTLIVLGTVYIYYSLYPKEYSMLPTLQTTEQRALWWDIYTEMKKRSLMGFLLGVVAFLLIGYIVSKSGSSN